MFKKLALSAVVALSSFAAVPAAMAEPFCTSVTGGTACMDASYRYGWDTHDYVAFDLYGYEWAGTISCHDNPSTYTWEYSTMNGYAPAANLQEFAEGYCEGRLYG